MKFKQFLLEEKQLSPADRWLKDYTYENQDRWPSPEVLSTLLDDYPYTGGTLYRGLNFKNEEQYNKFLEETEDCTVLETGSISSWTPVAGEATSFALTRPTYFLNHDLMQAESQKNKNRDYMIGHAGLILEATVGDNVGIDVRKSKFSKESEIILKPGKYKIKLHEKFIPFQTGITDENVKQEFMSIKTMHGGDRENRTDAAKFAHIMFRFKEFDAEMKSHLFKLITATMKEIKTEVRVDDTHDWQGDWNSKNKRDTLSEISVFWTIPGEFFLYYDFLHDADKSKIDSKVDKIFKQLDREFEEKTKGIDFVKNKFRIRVDPSIQLALKMDIFDGKLKFMKKIDNAIGQRYHELNSYDAVKSINAIQDPREKERAIDKMAKNIIQVLAQLNKNGMDH